MDRIVLPDVPAMARRVQNFCPRAVGTAFDVKAAEGDKPTEIALYDAVGAWGVNAKMFRAQLPAKGDVVLKINSPGGDVMDGIAIYNDLLAHNGKVRVEVTGVAASIASVIAMAGSTIAMGENSFLMVHNAWGVTVGNKNDHEKMIDLLDKIDGAIAKTYVARTKMGVRAVTDMMDAETWLTAKDAQANGFADEIITAADARGAKAMYDFSMFTKAPAELMAALPAAEAEEAGPAPTTIRDLERTLMRDAGLSRSKARAMLQSARAVLLPPATQDAGEQPNDCETIANALKDLRRGLFNQAN